MMNGRNKHLNTSVTSLLLVITTVVDYNYNTQHTWLPYLPSYILERGFTNKSPKIKNPKKLQSKTKKPKRKSAETLANFF